MSLWREYLTFNKRERNGLFILSGILICLVAFNFWISNTEYNAHQPDFTEFETAVNTFYSAQNKQQEISSINDSIVASNTENKHIEYFLINPNTPSNQDFLKLGLSEKQLKNIRNYLDKAGAFRFKEDFGKLYAIGDSLFTILNPYIDLPDKESYYSALKSPNTKQENTKNEKQKIQKPLLELNSADSLQLIDVKGIGPAFASRIIKYRNKLGGFQRVEQLMEVYGMKEDQYDLIKSQVKVNPAVIIKININTCTAEELKNHPYVNNWNIANALINYRKKHG
jgi:competence ComEA-like helix-hairpin-helix protein